MRKKPVTRAFPLEAAFLHPAHTMCLHANPIADKLKGHWHLATGRVSLFGARAILPQKGLTMLRCLLFSPPRPLHVLALPQLKVQLQPWCEPPHLVSSGQENCQRTWRLQSRLAPCLALAPEDVAAQPSRSRAADRCRHRPSLRGLWKPGLALVSMGAPCGCPSLHARARLQQGAPAPRSCAAIVPS